MDGDAAADNNNILQLAMPGRKRREPASVWKLPDRVKFTSAN